MNLLKTRRIRQSRPSHPIEPEGRGRNSTAGNLSNTADRPNLSEQKHAEIGDWSGFVKAFTDLDIQALRSFPTFLEDIIWEKEYRKIEWKDVPFRKTLTEFLN